MGRRRTAGKAPQREEGWPGDGKHRPQGQDGERRADEDAIPPRHPRGPPAARCETIPNPRHPRGNNTQRPLAAGGSSQRGDRPQRPGGQGSRCYLTSPSPLSRAASPWPQRQGTPCLHLGGRRTQRPCEANPQPQDLQEVEHKTCAPQRGD